MNTATAEVASVFPQTFDTGAFRVAAPGCKADPPRPIHTAEGVGDRLRAVAFAELQAMEAFRVAAEVFTDAPAALKRDWIGLSIAEKRHMGWLLTRMQELGVGLTDRMVSTQLWESFTVCTTARDFALFMAAAEDRGRRAGERFFAQIKDRDFITAAIFARIAEEEIEHIALAARYFPKEGG